MPIQDEAKPSPQGGMLAFIERAGNRLPSPVTLFLWGTLLVAVASHAAAMLGWSVTRIEPQIQSDGQVRWAPGEERLAAKSLLTSDGVWWLLSNMTRNFVEFPPLGVVLVGMLGIGVAEATGLMGAAIKAFMAVTPRRLLTPTVIFVGIMSSLTLDAGYIVLPPLAAVLFKAAGRSPVVGIAASFAGVSAGFNANLLVTALDPMIARLSTLGAQVVDASYEVAPTANLWFMIASTFTMTFAGWGVTAWIVEPRLARRAAEQPDETAAATDAPDASQPLTPAERRGLRDATVAFVGVIGLFFLMAAVPGWPLHGKGTHFDRWLEVIPPMIFLSFLIPGVLYGARAGTVSSEKDVAEMMIRAMANMAPIIVLAFVAAQFIASFSYSGLDKMLAMAGGQALVRAQLPPLALVVAFIALTLVFNLFIGSMSAKYTLFAPIFIPMLMVVGISPELTQAAYRIGDSVSNVVTPLNPYLIIILVLLQKHAPRSGMGTLIATMLPYTIAFTIVWTVQLALWIQLGWPLGIAGPLEYSP